MWVLLWFYFLADEIATDAMENVMDAYWQREYDLIYKEMK